MKPTVIASAPLVPEIRLHLITEACPLWHASEAEAGAAGLVEPYWVFCWPGGQALVRYLLDHPEVVAGKRVLDFGSGYAVEAIAALKSGAASALCADIDPLAALAAQERRAQRRLAGDHDPQLDWGEHRRRRRPRRRRLLRQGLAAAALDWLRGLDALVLIGDPARGFLDARARCGRSQAIAPERTATPPARHCARALSSRSPSAAGCNADHLAPAASGEWVPNRRDPEAAPGISRSGP